MKKTNTVRVNGNMNFKGQKLTLGMGPRRSLVVLLRFG